MFLADNMRGGGGGGGCISIEGGSVTSVGNGGGHSLSSFVPPSFHHLPLSPSISLARSLAPSLPPFLPP